MATLEDFGSSLNASKTMILSTGPPPEIPTYQDTKVGFIQVLHKTGSHKYLGRCFGGDLTSRAAKALEHRIGCAWAKFQSLASTLTNKHINIKLRLRLFDTVISPPVLYALETAPLTNALLRKLDVTQRCMLRRMVGWVCYEEDSWEERGRRMKVRLQSALNQYAVQSWSELWERRRQSLKSSMPCAPYWTKAAYQWNPTACAGANFSSPRRNVGRPRARW